LTVSDTTSHPTPVHKQLLAINPFTSPCYPPLLPWSECPLPLFIYTHLALLLLLLSVLYSYEWDVPMLQRQVREAALGAAMDQLPDYFSVAGVLSGMELIVREVFGVTMSRVAMGPGEAWTGKDCMDSPGGGKGGG
jgi:hypothetical protein